MDTRGYQEKMREMLDIAASQVDNSVRKQVGILYIAASQVDNGVRKHVGILYIHCCQSGGQQCQETGGNPEH